jgi:hypothetical protein
MKLSPRQIRMMYSHLEDPDMDEDFWPMMGVLAVIVAVWTGIIHLLDWLTFDFIPWWVEPFTMAPLIFLLAMKEIYGSLNPLHWWPMFWGYRVRLPDEDRVKIYPLDSEALFKKYGGRINIHIVDYEHIKFRRRRDAVMFGLTHFTF